MTYKIQIDDQIRDANTAEAELIENTRADIAAQTAAIEAAAAAKVSARTKLKALGLTDAEIAALIGG